MPLSPGHAVFEYRITRTLGQGAFGTVYLAQDTLLDRPVAIKELTAAAQADPVAFQRFLQEARAAGSLNHPHIVTVYALKPTDAAVYLVMEYLPGGSLRGLLSQCGRLPVEDAARIAADVCDGLAAAHAKGIVHRDVKPENILLTADGRAKVGDFGIAHVPRTAGGATVGGLTQTGFQPGTLVYMSPEQIRGEGVDGRSDVYQAGAILHEMLAGRHYLDIEALTRRAKETAGSNVARFQAKWFELLEEAICKHETPDLRRLRPDAPGWLGATVVAMLARQATARPTAEKSVTELHGGGRSSPARKGFEDGVGVTERLHDPILLAGALGLIRNDLKAGKINFQEGVNAIKALLSQCDHLSVEVARPLPAIEQPDFDVYAKRPGEPASHNAPPAAEPVSRSLK
jgi:serine/threonine protein kinase